MPSMPTNGRPLLFRGDAHFAIGCYSTDCDRPAELTARVTTYRSGSRRGCIMLRGGGAFRYLVETLTLPA
jgi:hypothetical protein